MPRTRTAAPKTAGTTKTPAAPSRRSARRPAQPHAALTHDAVAERAYHLYLAEGGGDSVAHWLRAEQELRAA